MSKIIRFGTNTETFNIKVYYNSSSMEVQVIEFPHSFERLDGLSQADLLQDVIVELDNQRSESFEKFADDVKTDQIIRKERSRKVKLKAVE